MKPKTIAESIADLRNKLDSIESPTATNILQESTQPSNRLHAHMQTIEQEYLEEGLLGGAMNAAKNFGRGMTLGKAKGALVKNPKVPGQKATWSRGPKTGADTAANIAGKATDVALAGGAAIAGDRWLNDKPMPWSDDNTKPDVKPDVKPEVPDVPPTTDTNVGGDAKPHSGLQYDPKVEKLQQFLNGQGASLDVDGKFGPHTQTAWEVYQQHKLSGHSSTHNVPNVPDVPDASATPVATPNANADADYNKQMQSSLDQLKDILGKIQQLSGNDPLVAQDLQNIMKPLQ